MPVTHVSVLHMPVPTDATPGGEAYMTPLHTSQYMPLCLYAWSGICGDRHVEYTDVCGGGARIICEAPAGVCQYTSIKCVIHHNI